MSFESGFRAESNVDAYRDEQGIRSEPLITFELRQIVIVAAKTRFQSNFRVN